MVDSHSRKYKKQKKSYTAEIAVIGSGYVGLVLVICLAELCKTVVCVDTDKKKI